MLPPRRGSLLGEILLFGTCLSLALPVGPALADPAGLPDWGVASKKPPAPAPAPTPAPEAAPAPAPTPTPEAAPAPTPEPDIVLDDAETAAPQPSQSSRRPKSTKSKSKPKPRVRVATAPTSPAPQPAPTPAASHKDAAHRNGHGEVLAGALLTTGGLASIGVMAGGLYLNRHSKRELDRGEGRPDQELAPLHDQKRQAETMIAAGAIAGAAGLALGIALLTIGARDLKAARRESLTARVRVAPTFGGFVLAGRF